MNTATTQAAQDELAELLSKIRGNSESDLEEAASLARCLYNRTIDELDLVRAKGLWDTLRINRAERERRANPTPGTCFECGRPTGGNSVQCRPCHEGYTLSEYNRTFARIF